MLINKIHFIYFFKGLLISFYFIIKYYELEKKYDILKERNKNAIIEKSFKIIAISYANKKYRKQLKLNKKSALEVGKVDEYYSYGPNNIDYEFQKKNRFILSQKRGNGYWLWKPYFILKTLKEKLNVGDYLIYTDAGILYMDSSYKIIDFLKKQNSEMWMIPLDPTIYIEKKYSKRDAFILLAADMPFYTDTPQYMAGIQVYRKSKFTEKFLEEVLYYSQDRRIITDEPNKLGLSNYKEFVENRHDQTVLSLMIKKYGQANSGKSNININKILPSSIQMPYIFCIYRQTKFKNYYEIKQKCIKDIKDNKAL